MPALPGQRGSAAAMAAGARMGELALAPAAASQPRTGTAARSGHGRAGLGASGRCGQAGAALAALPGACWRQQTPMVGRSFPPLKVPWCRGSSLSKAREICISVAFFRYGTGQPGAVPVQWMNPPKASGEASPAIRTRPGEAALPEQCHLSRRKPDHARRRLDPHSPV